MKQKVVDPDNVEDSKPKRRRIVSWSEEEDDILREQIMVLGTENWAVIASKFRDKTTRQCRRRWFMYLNSDFKKGGWSPEEDELLCEAQKLYGNRWTEIAKVVPGRTDNAVKNRFTTLCKKRDKREASGKDEDATSIVNLNNKRVISHTWQDPSGGPQTLERIKSTHVNTEKPDQSLNNTSMVLHGYGKPTEERNLLATNNLDTDFQLEKFQVLVENLGSCDEGSGSSCGDESSPTTSESSRESSLPSNAPETGLQSQSDRIGYAASASDATNIISSNDRGALFEFSIEEFSSPLHETPLFRALAAAIPSPQFSESEKHFLMKTLGMESPSSTRVTNPSQPPPCKRSLLHCL